MFAGARRHELPKILVIGAKRAIGCFTLLVLAPACTSNRQLADEAYLREDWDAAAANYAAALRDTAEPAVVAQIKPRLAESRTKAAAAHLSKAQELVAIGDVTSAHEQAKRAFDLNPTPEAQTLLGSLRSREADRFLAEGRAAVEHRAWDRAIETLRKAQELAPSDQARELLAAAESESAMFHRERFDALVADARTQLKERAWGPASARYAEALRHGSTTASQREAEFCRLMAEAEEKAASDGMFSQSLARSAYTKARDLGIDVEYVDARIRRITPARYSITIHGAIISPVKPDSRRPWDGARGAVEEADALFKGIGAFLGPEGKVTAGLASAVVRVGSLAMEAPDCFVSVTCDGRVFGGRSTIDQDDFEPAWNVGFTCDGVTSADRRIVSIHVIDADGLDDDNVGSVQMTLGDIVAVDGPRTIPFFSKDGVLQAGGILALKLSVERH